MTIRRTAVVSALLAVFVLLVGCGTTDDSTTSDASSSGAPVTLDNSAGGTVTLPHGQAHRIVSLEWEYAEILNSIGAGNTVVGLSDVKGYNQYDGPTVPLTSTPTDVGQRLEPSLETIADLQPDLIIASTRSIPDSVRDRLGKIAPIVVLSTSDPTDPIGRLQQTTRTLGTAVGKQTQADDLNKRLDAALTKNAETLKKNGHAGQHAVFASVSAEGSTVSIRMHARGSTPEAVLERMGLQPAWPNGDGKTGLSYVDVEGLTRLPADTWFLYWNEDTDPVEKNLASNPVWQSLPFVKDGRVRGVSKGVWMYGGPQSLIAFSDQVTSALS
ncbi:ABC transporter substrate-binding protein [Gordonia sp. DT30]|uniref:ABC transporter substrate-binding protein n=1 Tax=unclassified Gordonia (in: high G+C Gram-positive bacteria) TaxID=2657482 RepID=UPI003CF613A7